MFSTALYRTSLVLLALSAAINAAPISPTPPTYVLQNAHLNTTFVSTKINERDATGPIVSAYLCTDSHWQGYCEDIRTQSGVCCQSPTLPISLYKSTRILPSVGEKSLLSRNNADPLPPSLAGQVSGVGPDENTSECTMFL